jgi:demethylmenaquinone methyltransferase/2-methoxy-6-polyprenyl-1,4-benzoquinol methylase
MGIAESLMEEHSNSKAQTVRRMFGGIAATYALMNRIITFGMDSVWRRRVVEAASFPTGGLVLDVGSGTGDILLEAAKADRALRTVAVDFTPEMMAEGRKRKGADGILWCCADACRLPFRDRAFDGVVSGYLLRNVEDLRAAIREQVRVVRLGARVAALDTSPPSGLFRPLIHFYFRLVIPLLGQMIAHKRDAYEYLPRSTKVFLKPEKLAEIMEEEGLKEVRIRKFMLGTQVLLSGTRRPE